MRDGALASRALAAMAATVLAGSIAACGGVSSSAPPSAVEIPVRLPESGAQFAPAESRVDGSLSGEVLTETESCAGCHPDADAEWRSSAHAFGSFNNPV